MAEIDNSLCGCLIDKRETDRVIETLSACGCDPCLDSARPQLKGFWQSKGRQPIFLTDGDDDTAWSQAHGTCCGQGWGHALQTSIRHSLLVNKIGRKIALAWEPLYIMARTIIENARRGEGACVPHLAEVGYRYGLLERKAYSVDLSKPQENWAVQLSQPGQSKVPSDILKAMANYKLKSVMQVKSLDLAADALASGYALVRGADRATGSTRNADGITGTVQCGGHCEHIPIVFIDRRGDRIWGERNSWRGASSQPHGNGSFKCSDGSERQIPDGVGGIRDDDMQYYIDHGDLWCAEPPMTLWPDDNLKPSDMA
jgi:hypothetical protein